MNEAQPTPRRSIPAWAVIGGRIILWLIIIGAAGWLGLLLWYLIALVIDLSTTGESEMMFVPVVAFFTGPIALFVLVAARRAERFLRRLR